MRQGTLGKCRSEQYAQPPLRLSHELVRVKQRPGDRRPGRDHSGVGHVRTGECTGFQFLRVPDTYYDLLPARVARSGYAVREDFSTVKEMGVQVDGDETGYLLQIFSEDQIGPLFFEIIQRRGNLGFGEGNFQALYDSIELDQKKRGVL